MAMTRRIHPLCSLNPYQGSWTIKIIRTKMDEATSEREVWPVREGMQEAGNWRSK
ncbi:hypothetical protein QJS10_CPB17g00755 [Acorus calamus]|uniref:Uncharacterized protein n=1 Tax=Acorus calamus TaxID=4465 RepID=A0AAV9CY38_ACOCL|nr:hypothetical protein QJS10_CPB17g00755 [Acorus calamus]